ncbi:MAG: hypothetical protein ABJK25_15940 [Halieaceae bacterium]
MTEAEVVEVAAMWGGNVLTAFTIYISFTFAYLVTIFYVGDRLTSLQSVCASGLYFFAATSAILAQIGYMQAQFILLRETPNPLDGIYLVMAADLWVPYMAVMEFAGVFFSLYFMWGVKNPKTE